MFVKGDEKCRIETDTNILTFAHFSAKMRPRSDVN